MYQLNQPAPGSQIEKVVVGASHHTTPRMSIRRLTQAWPFRAKCAETVCETAKASDRPVGNNSSFVT